MLGAQLAGGLGAWQKSNGHCHICQLCLGGLRSEADGVLDVLFTWMSIVIIFGMPIIGMPRITKRDVEAMEGRRSNLLLVEPRGVWWPVGTDL